MTSSQSYDPTVIWTVVRPVNEKGGEKGVKEKVREVEVKVGREVENKREKKTEEDDEKKQSERMGLKRLIGMRVKTRMRMMMMIRGWLIRVMVEREIDDER